MVKLNEDEERDQNKLYSFITYSSLGEYSILPGYRGSLGLVRRQRLRVAVASAFIVPFCRRSKAGQAGLRLATLNNLIWLEFKDCA